MTDKEKIRKKIERLIRDLGEQRDVNLEDLCLFIDSLPEEPVSDDLEEAAEQAVLSVFTGYADLNTPFREEKIALVGRIFKAGAQWQKQQMMKGAAKGTVHHFNEDKTATVHYIDPIGVPMCYFTSPEGLKAGDKVKLIIVKED